MKFEKISYDQWKKDVSPLFNDETIIQRIYDDIQMPKRATVNSAGYDFYIPYSVSLTAGQTTKIFTGIRWVNSGDENYVLILCPRSSLGAKYGFKLVNTVGIVDADYCKAANEGHIMAIVNTDKDLFLSSDDRFMQGIILPFIVNNDDVATGVRTGGFGSTNVQEK